MSVTTVGITDYIRITCLGDHIIATYHVCSYPSTIVSFETPIMLSFHDRHRTSRAFSAVSKITAAVCLFYTGTARRCTLTMPFLFRCRRIRMSRYNVLICVDMSKATENFHASSSSSYTFCRLIAQAIHAYFEIFKSLHAPMLASLLRSLVCCNTGSA